MSFLSDSERPTPPTDLKKALAEALRHENVDHMHVLSLAGQLADTAPDFVRFSVDASHVERLGFELVGKQGTALGELVKNAYDADATVVTVKVLQAESPAASSIIVQDDGVGMSEEDLRRAWMRLSTPEKTRRPRSTRFNRMRAGKKGIGRFAAHRLGRILVLTTGQQGSRVGWRVRFDWDADFQRGADITQVRNRIESIEKNPQEEGTTLEILDLRDTWDQKALAEAWRSVQLLQSPLRDRPLGDVTQPEGPPADPGFEALLELERADYPNTFFDLESEFVKSAAAQISGEVDADGRARFTLHSVKLNLHEEHTHEEAQFPELAGARMEADYFIFSSDLMSGMKVQAGLDIAHAIGGIRLYRNGFRVPPYGDPNDDWLRLARDSARRNILVPANNSNFLGRVYITSEAHGRLEETASREGLIENDAYQSLVTFARACLRWGVLRVGWARDRKTRASEPRKRPTDSVAERVGSLLSRLSDAASERDAEAARREIIGAVSAFEDASRREREESIKYEAMLRVLASLGLSISVFAHEVRAASSFADDSTRLFLEQIRTLQWLEQSPDLEPLLQQIDSGVRRVIVLGDYLGGLTSYAGSRKLAPVSTTGVLEEFHERLGPYLEGVGVRLELQVGPPPLRTCPIHRSELDSVLFNLTTNALKAIKRGQPVQGEIRILAGQERNFIVLTVCDNGTGIDASIRNRIFDAFFTTTGGEEDEDTPGGAGLGLKIVADIAANYGGSVRVIEPPPDGMKTAIEFRLLAFDSERHTL